jgi:hypothetical protein
MRRTKLRTSRRPSSQRLSEKNDLAAARPERGRFRSFLLTSLKHFLANEWDRARAEKRGGGRSAANRLWDCRGAVPCRTEPRPDAQEDLRAAWGAGAARMLRVLDCRFSSHGLKPVRWQTLDQTKSHFLLCTILGIMSFKNDFMSLAFATESRTPACVADCLHSIHVEAALTSWSSSAVDFSLKSESLPSVIIRSFANCHQ